MQPTNIVANLFAPAQHRDEFAFAVTVLLLRLENIGLKHDSENDRQSINKA